MKYHAKRVIFEIAMRIYLTTVQPAVYSFSAAELHIIESEDEVFAHEVSC